MNHSTLHLPISNALIMVLLFMASPKAKCQKQCWVAIRNKNRQSMVIKVAFRTHNHNFKMKDLFLVYKYVLQIFE